MQSLQDFFVSPLIEGYDPMNFNVMTMDGAATWDVIDGVEYRIVECDNVEIFADHKLHLCVMDSTFYNKNAYNYDSQTGAITPNEEYEGMNLLFDLPLDASKADPDKVQEYLKDFTLMFPEADEAEKDSSAVNDEQGIVWDEELPQEYVDYITSGQWKKEVAESKRIIEKTVMDDKGEGLYTLDFQTDLDDGSGIGGTFYFNDWEFVDGVAVDRSFYSSSEEGMCYEVIAVAEMQEDKTVTLRAYDRLVPEQKSEEGSSLEITE